MRPHRATRAPQTVKCLLIVPNAESALNEEAGRLLLEDYEEYAKRARMMTEIHAMPAAKQSGCADAASAAQSGAGDTAASRAAAGDAAPAATGAPKTPAVADDKKKTDKKRSLKRL